MILASSLNVGKTETLMNLARDLTDFVQKAAQDGADLDSVERGALTQVLDIGLDHRD